MQKILSHAELGHGDREVVSAAPDGILARSNWAQVAANARRMAQALKTRGFAAGERLAFNCARHVESWYGIAGMGALYHPHNRRLKQVRLFAAFARRDELPDAVNISARDTIVPIVPMFHASAAFRGGAPSWCCRARASTVPRCSNCSTTKKPA